MGTQKDVKDFAITASNECKLIEVSKTITISSKVCKRVAENGKDHIIGYTFAKLLSATVKHPIILNHKANLTPLRLLIGLSDSTYRKQLNLALQLGYCVQEGKHLRLISHQQEYKQFHIRSAKAYQQIKTSDLTPFIQMSVIEAYVKHQQKGLSYKLSTSHYWGVRSESTTLTPFYKSTINHQQTLSVRKAADLLKVSVSNAHNILLKLKAKGLTLQKNSVNICKQDFRTLLANGSYNVRYQNGNYVYIGANLVTVKNVFKVLKSEQPKTKGYSYCMNDI